MLEAAFVLPGVVWGVRRFGYQRTRRLLARLAPSPPSKASLAPDEQATCAGLAWAVAAAAHHAPYTSTCLQRSLTLWWLLRRRRIAAELRIGVAHAGGELHAHAWLEHAGVVLNDDADVGSRFAAFDTLPDDAWPPIDV